MLITNLVLSELVPINIVLYIESSGSDLDTGAIFIHLLQPVRAQEIDEKKSDQEEVDESNKDEGNLSKEIDFSELTYLTSIDICCSWGNSLADGKLTYQLEYGDDNIGNGNNNENDNNKEDLELKKVVTAAVKEWNIKIANLELVEISTTAHNSSVLSKEDADIEVKFVQGLSRAGFEGGISSQIAGITTMTYDQDGFINKSTITLPKAVFYLDKEEDDLEFFAPPQYSSQKLKEVAIHEIGHALGIGHANFEGDIMNQSINDEGTASISDCDIRAVSEANHWKLMYNTTTPANPIISNINC